jgi:hypothetical protein
MLTEHMLYCADSAAKQSCRKFYCAVADMGYGSSSEDMLREGGV